MTESLHYETPENVRIEYRTAGFGTRLVAWILDMIILHVGLFVLFILFVIFGAALIRTLESSLDGFGEWLRNTGSPEMVMAYVAGVSWILYSFSHFLYGSFFELVMRGQTPGKRVCRIRVVKADGFVLEPQGILLRNILRVIDIIPGMFLVPIFNSRCQRVGDMAAGTVVVHDEPAELSNVRSELSERPAAEARYRFDYGMLGKLKPSDFDAVEQMLDRWEKLTPHQKQTIVDRLLAAVARKMEINPPPPEDRLTFLEDLLAAEYRRQDRRLG